MNRYAFMLIAMSMSALPILAQRTQVSHFNSNGALARGFLFSSGPNFVSGEIEVAAGCFGGSPSSNTHLFYFVNSFSPTTGSAFSFGEGCIPDAAFVADPSRKRLTLTIDIATLDPSTFFQSSSGAFLSTTISATWDQTDTQTFFNSGVSRETLNLPGLVFKMQQQGSTETHSANFSVNLLGLPFSQPDGGMMTFVHNVSVDITRTAP